MFPLAAQIAAKARDVAAGSGRLKGNLGSLRESRLDGRVARRGRGIVVLGQLVGGAHQAIGVCILLDEGTEPFAESSCDMRDLLHLPLDLDVLLPADREPGHHLRQRRRQLPRERTDTPAAGNR